MVYRPVTGRVLPLCYAGFVVWWLISGLAGGGRSGVSWESLAWMLAVGAAIYAVFWRPAVVVDPEGVRLLNVLRDVRVPWAALEAVETRYALTLVTAGHRCVSWAAGAPGRSGGPARSGHGRRWRAGEGDREGEGAPAARAAYLPRAGWVPGMTNPDRSSRSLRADSGAAAFMVEQAWAGWRERPQARVEDGGPVPRVPPVGVAWNLPVIAGPLLLVVVALVAGVLRV